MVTAHPPQAPEQLKTLPLGLLLGRNPTAPPTVTRRVTPAANPADWPTEAQPQFAAFHSAGQKMQAEMDRSIAAWSLDTDYDGRSLFPHQFFFPMAGKDEGWMKLKKDIRAELNEDLLKHFVGTVSLPFEAGASHTVAVKNMKLTAPQGPT